MLAEKAKEDSCLIALFSTLFRLSFLLLTSEDHEDPQACVSIIFPALHLGSDFADALWCGGLYKCA